MVERKAFFANPKHQYHVSQCGEYDVVPIMKRMEIIMSINVSFISGMNINFMENGENKSFSCKSKVSISCIPTGIT